MYEYGDVPVEGMTLVSVSCWLESSVAAEIVGFVEAVSCEETVTVDDPDDDNVTGVDALSVICNLKL